MPSTADQVSVHEVLVFTALQNHRHAWISNSDLAARVPSVSLRTVRAHVARWVRQGLVEQADVYPGPRYRLAPDAESRCGEYVNRVREAAGRFGDTTLGKETQGG